MKRQNILNNTVLEGRVLFHDAFDTFYLELNAGKEPLRERDRKLTTAISFTLSK